MKFAQVVLFLSLWLVCCFGVFIPNEAKAQEDALSAKKLQQILKTEISTDEEPRLAARIRGWIGIQNLERGPAIRVEGRTIAFIVSSSNNKKVPMVIGSDGKPLLEMTILGDTGLYVGTVDRPEGEYMSVRFEIGGQKIGEGTYESYEQAPESKVIPDVPQGLVLKMPVWKSNVFAGTLRDWWIYVPKQYKADKPACLMVFQDGGGYVNFAPIVMDNLIFKQEMPITIGVFINPGTFPDSRSNRSFEYDRLSPQYVKMLTDEILPEVGKRYKIRPEATNHAIMGASSGGICAFTAAWERPDVFGRVVSWIGSFTGIAAGQTLKEGGNNYPTMIRKTPKKQIRVFLQDGENDLDNEHGNWPLANQEMAKALAFRNYDYKFVFGKGAHNYNHGRAIFPDTLRWIWQGVQ